MALAQNANPQDPGNGIQGTKIAVIATLLASLIGGLFGFGGSLLIFFSSEKALQEARGQHIDDVRREIYVDLVIDAAKLQSALYHLSNLAIIAGRTLNDNDCKTTADLFTAKNASVDRVYMISSDDVNKAAYLVGKALDDWWASVCAPDSPYTKEMRNTSTTSVDDALYTFRTTAKTTLAK